MDLLLDTHAFIWFFNGDEQLSIKAKKLIQDSKAIKYISIASIWEIAIKIALNKLVFDGSISEVVELIHENGFKILQISVEHLVAYEELELTHRDPFDRILLVQAMVEKMSIITKDENIHKYQVKTLW